MNEDKLFSTLIADFATLSNRQIGIAAVNLDKEISAEFKALSTRFPSICFVQRGDDSAQPPTIFGQYPARVIPQAILINPDGILVRAALPVTELINAVNQEIARFEKK